MQTIVEIEDVIGNNTTEFNIYSDIKLLKLVCDFYFMFVWVLAN